MARIQVIEESDATGEIKTIYDQMQGNLGFVPNVMKLFSLWPEVCEENYRMFEAVMLGNTELSNATKEMIALVVSKTNKCNYCVTHHSNFLVSLGVNKGIVDQLRENFWHAQIDEKTRQLLDYTHKITLHASEVTNQDTEALRYSGWRDRQILEATVVAAQFNFINRIAEALGAELESVDAKVS